MLDPAKLASQEQVLDTLAEKRDLTGADLSGLDLSGNRLVAGAATLAAHAGGMRRRRAAGGSPETDGTPVAVTRIGNSARHQTHIPRIAGRES